MSETLESQIKQAVEEIIRCEQDLHKAQQNYETLITEANRKGIEVPWTILTNPFIKHR